MLRTALISLSLVALTGCSGVGPAPSTAPAENTPATTTVQPEATARIGDIIIRASAVQASMLDPGIARQYGIARNAGTILLLVAIRQGAEANAFTLPATVTASVTDLRGSRQKIEMRALHSGDADTGTDLIDYVGTVETSLPDTLRFDIRVQPEGVKATTLQLSRDFYPQ